MSIYTVPFSVYERLASAKMEAFRSAINSHTHDGVYGVQLLFSNLTGQITASQIANDSITGAMIAHDTIEGLNIAGDTITMSEIDQTSIHLSNDGYAVYAP